jgi:parallel beta-helix repeat protein
MLRRNLSFALLASGSAAALMAKEANAQTCTAPCYALTPAETAAGVTTSNSNQAYLPGDVRRYKADPTGATDSTAALNLAIATGYSLYFCDGSFLTSGNLSPVSNTSWWGTGTLKSSGSAAGALVTLGAITKYTFAINTDCTLGAATPRLAISASGTADFTIQDGTHLHGAIAIGAASACSNFSINNNAVMSAIIGAAPSAGAISLNAKCTNFEITNNRVTNSSASGITIYNGATQGVVANNVCTGCGGTTQGAGSGILVDSATYLTIEGNTCSYNTQCGIELSPHSPSTTGYVSFCTIANNLCNNNTYDGIDYNLSNSTSVLPTFTTVSGNVLVNNGTTGLGGTGIYLVNAANTTVSGNNIAGNNVQGIFLNNSSYCTISGNMVTANGASAPNTLDGIYINGTYNTISGNCSTNNGSSANQRYGISESSTSNYNTIVGNSLNNNASGAANVVGANTLLQGNMPVDFDKMLYSKVFSSFTAPGVTGVPNGSLWMNPGAGLLYVLQSGAWVAK